jgi:hypothetical protein
VPTSILRASSGHDSCHTAPPRTIAFVFSPLEIRLSLSRHLNHADRRGPALAARLHSRRPTFGGAADRACAVPRMQSPASHGPDGVERSAEPAGAANRTCAGEEEWRYGALRERVLDDDAPGCRLAYRITRVGMPRATEARWRDNVSASESGIESLVRPGGWRRLRRFAGRTDASSVACRARTPDPATAIQAVTGSGVDAGQVGGTRSINKDRPSERVTAERRRESVDRRRQPSLWRGYQAGTCVPREAPQRRSARLSR